MSNIVWKYLALSPAVFGATLLVSTTAIAASKTAESEVANGYVSQAEKIETEAPSVFSASVDSQATQTLAQAQQTEVNVLEEVTKYGSEGQENGSQSQVTSVSQFSDVQPTDWAFQALQSLVERYGCIAGYPNGTYRGNRALTRYEFAAGLNACLDRVNELIATATADIVTREDLATLQRLQEEFSAELATLRGRVDALEARTAEIEANQFSTTTKLAGEAIFALTDAFGDSVNDQNNTVFQNRIRLDLQTSFTGKDVLHTRLATGNAGRLNTGTDVDGDGVIDASGEGFQTFNLTGDASNSNDVKLDWLAYYTNLGPAQLYIAATGGIHSDYAATVNPYFEDYDGGNGALSTFASESPIYRIGGGAGAALNIKFGEGTSILRPSSLTVGYLASEPNDPSLGAGIFNGNYAALGQLNFNVSNRIALAATYVHGYHGAGSNLFDAGGFAGTTTNAAGQTGFLPVVGTTQANRLDNPSSSNSYGLAAAIRPSDRFSVSGFVSYHDVTGFGAGDDYEAWSWGAGIALPDFGGRGNVLGIFGGAQPYSLNRALATDGRNDADVPYHIEGFYKYRVNDNVSITPGVIYQTSSGQNSDNEDVFIGTLRTTFTF
ncbi:iron uptake porin [Plectonema cf. radiosum LEGE 06105]|uniref:Iron uptake porin n=1 Tax=Plectonema cf. radiosum LEGE 06105 TaxID=945769 RepID=A0A8J7FC55_9CYAN|nr:iron uptake porin [Plectonema radiosum]MBE9211556.1 iron uptake porin [Plectonema cf. radiosum LEGE 06105]